MSRFFRDFKKTLNGTRKKLRKENKHRIQGFYFPLEFSKEESDDLFDAAKTLFDNGLLRMPFDFNYVGMMSDEGDFCISLVLEQVEDHLCCKTIFTNRGDGYLEQLTYSDGEPVNFNILSKETPFGYISPIGDNSIKPRLDHPYDKRLLMFLYRLIVTKIASLHIGGFTATRKSLLSPGKAVSRRRESKNSVFVINLSREQTTEQESQQVNSDGTPRLRPRLHMRRGHIRKQRVGVGRKELKEVFVRPCLVGHEEDGTIFRDLYEVG